MAQPPSNTTLTSLDLSYVILTNLTCFASMMSCLAIASFYLKYPDVRTTGRKLLLHLSAANFLQCLGSLLQVRLRLTVKLQCVPLCTFSLHTKVLKCTTVHFLTSHTSTETLYILWLNTQVLKCPIVHFMTSHTSTEMSSCTFYDFTHKYWNVQLCVFFKWFVRFFNFT